MANQEHVKILAQGSVVWNSWREKNPQIIPDLEGASLLRYWLDNVNLCDAKLLHVNLTGAELGNANLKNADLRVATIRGAQLVNANFTGANLNNADISLCLLDDADFSGAHFGFTGIARTNLAGAKGLDKIIHDWPSNITTDTLEITAKRLGDSTVKLGYLCDFLLLLVFPMHL